jgi:hypothetical protein
VKERESSLPQSLVVRDASRRSGPHRFVNPTYGVFPSVKVRLLVYVPA